MLIEFLASCSNLAARNMLVTVADGKYNVKISDFGLRYSLLPSLLLANSWRNYALTCFPPSLVWRRMRLFAVAN